MVSYLEFTPKEFKQGVLEAFDAIYNRKINSPLGFDQENILQEIKDICIKYHSITDRYSYLGLFEENKDNFLFYAYISEFPDGDSTSIISIANKVSYFINEKIELQMFAPYSYSVAKLGFKALSITELAEGYTQIMHNPLFRGLDPDIQVRILSTPELVRDPYDLLAALDKIISPTPMSLLAYLSKLNDADGFQSKPLALQNETDDPYAVGLI